MSTLNVAIIESSLFGDSVGNAFNDLESIVGFPKSITISSINPISKIKVMHGGAVDGIKVTYKKSDSDSDTTSVSHGTSEDSTDSSLSKSEFTLGGTENIVAISGRAGSSDWGIRVTNISFAIYDSSTGKMTVQGPYGGSSGTPFHVTANGIFVAFDGFAIDTDLSLAQLKAKQQNGGLYGLTFAEVAYRSV